MMRLFRHARSALRAVSTVFIVVGLAGTALAAECNGNIDDHDLAEAAQTVQTLYAMPEFADARTDIPDSTVKALEPYLTDGLVTALLGFTQAVSAADQSTDTLTKSPIPTGPVFHSNYEGMDAFKVLVASAGTGRTVRVTVDMTFESSLGDTKWSDVAVLLCQTDRWKLDDILFDETQTAGPSLRTRITLE